VRNELDIVTENLRDAENNLARANDGLCLNNICVLIDSELARQKASKERALQAATADFARERALLRASIDVCLYIIHVGDHVNRI